MERRGFLTRVTSLLGTAIVSREGMAATLVGNLQNAGMTDEDIAAKVFAQIAKAGVSKEQIGDVMIAIGSSFIGTPYVAHSLEAEGPEHLVVNLRGLDCTTFVESVFALSRCVKLGTTTFDAYRTQLTKIRYRDGVIAGYPSRLHYFLDWIGNNETKHLVKNVTHELGGVAITKPIDFMTTHREAYKQLADESFIPPIAEAENRLSSKPYSVINKTRIAAVENQIHNGDIIALATSVKGIEISHVGLAVRTGKTIKFLHAPLSGGSVTESERSLADYVEGISKATGIMVVRPLAP
jgi:cell wall-associated NlpC family hydrolase